MSSKGFDVTSWMGPRTKRVIKCRKCGTPFKRNSRAAKQCPECRKKAKLVPRVRGNASTMMVAKKSTLRPPK